MKITGEQCRKARALVRWTETDLAKYSNVTVETITEIEAGKRRASENTIVKLHIAFNRVGVLCGDGRDPILNPIPAYLGTLKQASEGGELDLNNILSVINGLNEFANTEVRVDALNKLRAAKTIDDVARVYPLVKRHFRRGLPFAPDWMMEGL